MSEFSIQKIDQVDGPADVEHFVIRGEMTILNTVEIRNTLLDTFSNGKNLLLDLTGVTEVDLTGLQIICAAHMSAIKAKKNFALNKCESESIMKSVHDAGFLRHIGCSVDISSTCVWTGGERQ